MPPKITLNLPQRRRRSPTPPQPQPEPQREGQPQSQFEAEAEPEPKSPSQPQSPSSSRGKLPGLTYLEFEWEEGDSRTDMVETETVFMPVEGEIKRAIEANEPFIILKSQQTNIYERSMECLVEDRGVVNVVAKGNKMTYSIMYSENLILAKPQNW